VNWTLTRLRGGDPFPPQDAALPARSPYPGLLAVGGTLDAATLRRAYAQGVFPWFEPGSDILWWCTDPRMVLNPGELVVRRSLRQAARRFLAAPDIELRVDHDFRGVMRDCAAPRRGVPGSWIGAAIIDAYGDLHDSGAAHSFELWQRGERVAGLYLVALGGMLFGESMYTRIADGSKFLLMALCGFALAHGLGPIDCQQQTAHLASLGARPWAREAFLRSLQAAARRTGPPAWTYDRQQMCRDCAAWL
jgi:leucyl/phenylalanyl-tRNA--protein transferase